MAEHGARALGGTGGVVCALDARGDDAAHDRQLGLRAGDRRRRSRALPLAAALPVDRRGPRAADDLGRLARGARARAIRRWPRRAATARCAPCRCSAGDAVLGAVGVSRAGRARFDARRARAAGGARRARAGRRSTARGSTSRLQRACRPDDRGAGARADAAGGRGDRRRRRARRRSAPTAPGWRCWTRTGARSSSRTPPATRETTQQRFASLPLDAELPLAAAARTAEPLWLESPEAIFGPYPRFREVRPQAQAAALLPLVRRRRGARRDRARVRPAADVFGPHDRDYLLALTRLCGQALGRARRYQTEHDLAATLQQALLPEALPQADGLELAVRYLPAADGDGRGRRLLRRASSSRGGRLGIAVGDIVGHGPEAAAAMGQLRSALRAYALEGRAPARVLQLLSRYADGVPGARGATLVYAVIDPARARGALRLAPAIRRRCWSRADGDRASWRARRGVPLDRALGHVYVDATAPRARVRDAGPLLRRRDRAPRRAARRRAWTRLARRPPRRAPGWRPRRSARGCWRRSRPARAAARRRRAAGRARARAPASRRCTCGSPRARTSSRSCARRCGRGSRARAWSRATASWSCSPPASCARTRSSTPTRPAATRRSRSRSAREPGGVLTLVVRDRGRWRPPPADPGDRGRGLAIVRALMHAVDIDEGGDGTTVSVRYRPGARAAGAAGDARPAGGRGRASSTACRVAHLQRRDRPLQRRAGRARAAGAGARAGGRRPLAAGFLGSAGLRCCSRSRSSACGWPSSRRRRAVPARDRSRRARPRGSHRRHARCGAGTLRSSHDRRLRALPRRAPPARGQDGPGRGGGDLPNDPGFVWLGMVEPSPEELAGVQDTFGLHELAVEDAQSFHLRPKVEAYEGGITFVVLRTARYVDEREEVEFGEVSIFVGPGFIITVRQGVASDLHGARLRLEAHPKLLEEGPGRRAVGDPGQDRRRLRAGRRGPRDRHRGGREDSSSRARARRPSASTCCGARSPTSTAPCTRCSAPPPRSPRAACWRSAPGLRQYFRDVDDHLKLVNEEIIAQRDLLSHDPAGQHGGRRRRAERGRAQDLRAGRRSSPSRRSSRPSTA